VLLGPEASSLKTFQLLAVGLMELAESSYKYVIELVSKLLEVFCFFFGAVISKAGYSCIWTGQPAFARTI
jgi:hypothetical protein